MKTRAKQLLCLCLALLLVLGLTACGGSGSTGGKKAELLSMDARPDAPSEIPEGLDIDWNYRYTFAELEGQLARLAETYPDITNLYSIGTSWQERDLWCMELTNKAIPAGKRRASAYSPTSTAASGRALPPPCIRRGGWRCAPATIMLRDCWITTSSM